MPVAAAAVGARLHLGPDRLRPVRGDGHRHPASRLRPDPRLAGRGAVHLGPDLAARPPAHRRGPAHRRCHAARQLRGPVRQRRAPGAPAGATRLYLISDDGAISKSQRTLLLAFDWVAPPAPQPLPPKPARKSVRRR
ncbi:hypothetical protein ACRAWD_29210 [Caulobacter segnis]